MLDDKEKEDAKTIETIQQVQQEIDLEKEIDAVWNPRFNLGWDEHSCLTMNRAGFESVARHFAEWQKSQMLKEAVKGEVYKFGEIAYVKECSNAELTKYLSQFNNGDKVKIIVIHETDIR